MCGGGFLPHRVTDPHQFTAPGGGFLFPTSALASEWGISSLLPYSAAG